MTLLFNAIILLLRHLEFGYEAIENAEFTASFIDFSRNKTVIRMLT